MWRVATIFATYTKQSYLSLHSQPNIDSVINDNVPEVIIHKFYVDQLAAESDSRNDGDDDTIEPFDARRLALSTASQAPLAPALVPPSVNQVMTTKQVASSIIKSF